MTPRFQRSHFLQNITIIRLMRQAQHSRLDFWGPIALVIAFGIAGKLIQLWLAN